MRFEGEPVAGDGAEFEAGAQDEAGSETGFEGESGLGTKPFRAGPEDEVGSETGFQDESGLEAGPGADAEDESGTEQPLDEDEFEDEPSESQVSTEFVDAMTAFDTVTVAPDESLQTAAPGDDEALAETSAFDASTPTARLATSRTLRTNIGPAATGRSRGASSDAPDPYALMVATAGVVVVAVLFAWGMS
jgi:hypothetical protein